MAASESFLRLPPETAPDLDLVRRVLAGDEAATAQFLQRMAVVRRVLAACNARDGRPLDATALEDAVQDAYLTVWRRLHTYAGLGPLEAFAYRIARFTWLARLRALRRRPDLAASPSEADWRLSTHDPPPDLEEFVHAILEVLPALAAAIVRLKHFEDLTFEQIAARLALPSGTVKTRYYRALRALRERLDRGERR